MAVQHPNATVAAGTGGTAAVLVWLAQLFGLDIPPVAAVVMAGALTTAMLAVGREGLKGLADRLWRGSGA